MNSAAREGETMSFDAMDFSMYVPVTGFRSMMPTLGDFGSLGLGFPDFESADAEPSYLSSTGLGAMGLRHTIDRTTETPILDAQAPFSPLLSTDSTTESIMTSTSHFRFLDTPPPLRSEHQNCLEELETRAKPDEDDWEIHKPFIEQLYI